MNKRVAGVFSMVLMAGIVLPARSASATIQVSTFKLRDKSLIADFEDASDDGCFVTQTHILFSEGVSQTSGPPIIQPPTTQVTIDYANACTGEFFELAGGTAQQTVQIAGDLSKASLSTIVPVTGDTGNANVTINIKWTANAPTQQAKGTNISRDANTITIDHFNFETRAADVSGTVASVLLVQAGPTFFDLSRFPEGGQVGKNADGTRTVTFIHGH